ncbi:MAG TPA: hypothetical protein VFX19_13495, partial [Dehalococcoidia bacterium]|nr:hypothetical protein [Dehalococcoidia bacterium]
MKHSPKEWRDSATRRRPEVNHGSGLPERWAVVAVAAVLALLAVGSSWALGPPPRASADGNGSPTACLDTTPGVMGSVTGTDDLVTSTVEADEVVTGVCIKSGANMFPPDTHSGVLDNGTYENDCYQVSGVGTQTVTVTRIGTPSSTCQAISHIDVVFEQAPPPETGTLLIEKACNGTDDGSIFTINVSGGIGPVELGCGDTSEALTVDADTEYTVSETPPAGWTGPQFSGDCSDGTVTVEAEATATCTVTNTAGEPNTATATLLIMKECVGTDDGSTFTINVSGGIGPVELGCGDTSDPLTVDADTEYTVSETP